MASRNSFKKISITPAHLPTVILMIGYPLFWLEMGAGSARDGVTSPLAWLLFAVVSFFALQRAGPGWLKRMGGIGREFYDQSLLIRLSLAAAAGICAAMIGLILYASLFPPHLPQEYDVLNYHYTLPRQHLILGSFAHIPWSSADLWPLPIQFALAPFWFVTALPNKVPQFIFFLGLLAVAARLTLRLSGQPKAAFWCVLALLGSHGLGVQMGTAMLDITLVYLLVAALDSFLSRHWLLASIEFTFFFWAKALMPLLMTAVVLLTCLTVLLCRRLGRKRVQIGLCEGETDLLAHGVPVKKLALYFVLFGLLVGGPFALKALRYCGTPFYPLFPGNFNRQCGLAQDPVKWDSVLAAAKDHRMVKDSYGRGRSLTAFFHHLWLLSVPERGVNNRFDYPLGLPYLLVLGPFLFYILRLTGEKRTVSVLGFFVICYWFVWWWGTQQSRFLFVPLVLMIVVVLPCLVSRSRVFPVLLVLSVALTLFSVSRAMRGDLGRDRMSVLRRKDAALVQKSRKYLEGVHQDIVVVADHEVAFAQFPVFVPGQRLPWVIKTNR